MYIDIKFFVISLQYMKDMCLLKRINPKKITISLFSFQSFDCSYYMQKCQKQADGENLWYFKLWLFARGFGPFPRMLCLLTSIWPIHHNFFFYIFCSCTVYSVQCTRIVQYLYLWYGTWLQSARLGSRARHETLGQWDKKRNGSPSSTLSI